MGALSDAGRAEADAIGRRHGMPPEAVETLLAAIRRGGGRQAQFSHPSLGGMGQWSRGGGVMIGDMFNHPLKAKVEQLCNELAERVENERLFSAKPAPSTGRWWPEELGHATSTGSQDEQGYACFPETRRLAIRDGAGVRIYDTGDHRISGVSQQQGGGRDLAFTSQHGTVRLHEFDRIGGDAMVQRGIAPGDGEGGEDPRRLDESRPHSASPGTEMPSGGSDVLATLERLHELQHKGVLTEAEFSAKKKELLARL